MTGLQEFADWMDKHRHVDKKTGRTYMYHPRSNAHSIKLCELLMQDLSDSCPVLQRQGRIGKVAYAVNAKYQWPASRKAKETDLIIGVPKLQTEPEKGRALAKTRDFKKVLMACEAKATMTEHKKSHPRVFDELASSHEIVHQGDPECIATGITIVNIAKTFVSPLRNQRREDPAVISHHKQPEAAASTRKHLLGIPLRDRVGDVGFDAYCTVIVDCDNQTGCTLCTEPPAPQPGDPDHYDTFIRRIGQFYSDRFGFWD